MTAVIVAKRVFISYRREDTAPAAGRVYDRLCQLLSKPNVFFDVSTIAGGEIFDRNVGAGSRLKIERGLNALWKDKGLQYAPPIR